MLILGGVGWILGGWTAAAAGGPASAAAQGVYFQKHQYDRQVLPQFADLRDRLPSPIFDEQPDWVAMYWKAWELGFRNFHEPAPQSHFVSQFIDAAFNQNIFEWDTCFMSMFCNSAHPLVPGIESLDNFYARQHADGEICREINRTTGRDYAPWSNAEDRPLFTRNGWAPPDGRGAAVEYRGRDVPEPAPLLTLDGVDNPLFAWAELESLRVTGDTGRLAQVYEPLVHYYGALQKYLRQGSGLYVTDWASMDNSPRNALLARGGTAVDTSAQMALFARQLATMANLLRKSDDAARFTQDADELGTAINRLMWDRRRKFYFDLTWNEQRSPVRTVAAFWTLLSGVASAEQAEDLVAALRDPRSFSRPLRVPTLAVDEPGYDPAGGYWTGAVWAPTTMMVIRGLEAYGYRDEAHSIAINNLAVMDTVFRRTGTIWENYAPEAPAPGLPAKRDFVGWSGLGPIDWLLEFGIGLQPDALSNTLHWEMRSAQRAGCDRYRFNGHLASLVAEPMAGSPGRSSVTVSSDGAFILQLDQGDRHLEIPIHAGAQTFVF
ncbi:MAG TPA: trehalase family glycosidase [Opitutaceae bacterium]|jgi:hypothetical protein